MSATDEIGNLTDGDVSIRDAPVSDVIGGPLAAVVRHCLETLAAVEGSGVVGEAMKQELSHRLMAAYSELSSTDRQSVDKQLVDILYLLTTRGFDVNAFCDVSKRQTPMHVVASLRDSARIIRALHAAGTKINAVDSRQQTALHIAAKIADVGNTQALLDCGANVNQQDCNGQSPLHLTAAGKRHHLDVMQLLIRCRADSCLADHGRQTALHLAVRAGSLAQVRQLIVNGKVRLNQRDAAGRTALHLAALYDVTGNVVLELLRNRKTIDVNALDDVAMETPLHRAMRHNMLDNVKLLLRARADVNIAGVTGETCMHCAARTLTDLSVWNTLLYDAHGDVTVRTVSGLTVRRVAIESKNLIANSALEQFENMDLMSSHD